MFGIYSQFRLALIIYVTKLDNFIFHNFDMEQAHFTVRGPSSLFVSGCKTSGVYGNDCKQECPTNCKDNVCHIQMGTCFGCKPGWANTSCQISMIKITSHLYVAIS